MAEQRPAATDYEPFPTGAQVRQTRERQRRQATGCAVGGGLGLLGVIAAIVILGSIASSASSCEIGSDLGDPGQGTASKRVAVTMSPTIQLADGDTVYVKSEAFAAKTIVGVTQCLREADTASKGVDACDEIQGYRYAVPPDGTLRAAYRVHRLIRVGGTTYDCGERKGRCLLVAASADDFNTSGGRALSFVEAPAPTEQPPSTRARTDHLPIGSEPKGPLVGGSDVQVLASGFQPNEPVLVAWCTDEFETGAPEDACEPVDLEDAMGALMFRMVPDAPLANAEGSVVLTIEARQTIAPYGSAGGASGKRFDCRTAPGRCSVVIAAAADTKRSAVLPYTLKPA